MSTATNHRARSHRTYYISHSAIAGHAKQSYFNTQDPFKIFGPFKGLFNRDRNREAET